MVVKLRQANVDSLRRG